MPIERRHVGKRLSEAVIFTPGQERIVYLAGQVGERSYRPLWWWPGRFVELWLRTGAEPLHLVALTWREAGYPLAGDGSASASDPRWAEIGAICERTQRACTFDGLVDSLIEQGQFISDARNQAHVIRAMTRDHRLIAATIDVFDRSRDASGWTACQAPMPNRMLIPGWSLAWIGMVHDHWLWADTTAASRHLPGIRAQHDAILSGLGSDGLLRMPWWNFIDWVTAWGEQGVPPGHDAGAPGAINTWWWAWTLRQTAAMEEATGELELAARWRRLAAGAEAAAQRLLWDDGRGAWRDAPDLPATMLHTQAIALLAGIGDAGRRLRTAAAAVTPGGLTPATYYFRHFVCEALAGVDGPSVDAAIHAQLAPWLDLPSQGFTTVPETPEPSRSDCHGWCAHPRFHLPASIVGLRPATPGFAAACIRPHLGSLAWAEAVWPHVRGDIRVRVERIDEGVLVRATVPEGLPVDIAGTRYASTQVEAVIGTTTGAQKSADRAE